MTHHPPETPAIEAIEVQVPLPERQDGEQVLEGIGVTPGIAIGPVYLFTRDDLRVEPRKIADDEVEAEVERFEHAISKAERDLKKITSVAREKLGDESADIFEAHLMMLHDDASLREPILEQIREERSNADYAVKTVMSGHRRRLEASESERIRERGQDLADVQDRIIRHLRRGKILSDIDPESIVVAENLSAADIVLFSRRGILGCAMDYGGATSHVSIMARALNIPMVVSLHGLSNVAKSGDLAIVDGVYGRILLNPDAATLAFYRNRQEKYLRLLKEQKHLVPLPAETRDGHRVTLRANLEFREELDLLAEYGAEGIGLFRTEILFLMRGRITLSEDEQYDTYKRIVEAVRPAMTTFRVLDLGGDKMLPVAHREHNPFLGWRGIRVLLDKPEVLLPQLRSILRASAEGPVRILLPMVTNIEEVRRFKRIVKEVEAELHAQDHAYQDGVEIGVMVEVPAVALQADLFAAEADFLSIGTNDLTQYVLAVDRGNDLVASLYHELHPAVLALIKQTIDAGHRHGIPVSLCGEMAAHPRATPILLGLGLDEFSASPIFLPEVKQVIRAMKKSDAEMLAAQALQANDAEDITRMIDAWLHEHAGKLAEFLDPSPLGARDAAEAALATVDSSGER